MVEPSGGVVNYQALSPAMNNSNALASSVRQDTEGSDISIRVNQSGVHMRGVILGYFTDITGITGAEIASDTVTSANIQDGTLTYGDTNVDSIQRRVSSSCMAARSCNTPYAPTVNSSSATRATAIRR